MTSVNVTTTKNTVTVNGETRVVTVKTAGPQGPTVSDGDKGDVTVSSNGTNIVVNAGAINNAKVASDAAIAGTKISPDFGSQNITTTGNVSAGQHLALTGTVPHINFNDSDNNPDYRIVNRNGSFNIEDISSNILFSTTTSQATITQNLDCSAGVDITGDLTVSGNMTVSGTTTTIDTTTLTVEDKNIELGKVSTPTDTTADGGGITLKGATDKTFQWLDATDSWTSSEHIALPDDKKLHFGGSQDLEIRHSSSGGPSVIRHFANDGGTFNDLFIDSGKNIKFRSHNNGSTFENMAIFDKNGAIQLYNDGSLKFQTTSTGVTVTGSLTISDTTPEIFLTDTNNDSDFKVYAENGTFHIMDVTNSENRFRIESDGDFDLKGNVRIPLDDKKLTLGASADLELYHSSSNSLIANNTGTLLIRSDALDLRPNTNNGEVYLRCTQNGSVELRFDTVKKLETQTNGTRIYDSLGIGADSTSTALLNLRTPDGSSGNNTTKKGIIIRDGAFSDGALIDFQNSIGNTDISVDGSLNLNISDNHKLQLGDSQDLQIFHTGSGSVIDDVGTGHLHLRRNGSNRINITDNAVQLAFDGTSKLETTSTGITASGTQHLFTSSTSGDCTVIIEADTDNNDESDNPKIIFRQDGGLDLGSIGMNLTDVTDVSPSNELYIATSSAAAAIVFATGTTNGYTNSTERLRITHEGNIQIPDNGKLQLGTSQDLELYYDSSNSYIKDNGTGDLKILTTGLHIRNAGDTKNMAIFTANAAVELYYNHVKKLETTSTGVTVTGVGSIDNSSSTAGIGLEIKNSSTSAFSTSENLEGTTNAKLTPLVLRNLGNAANAETYLGFDAGASSKAQWNIGIRKTSALSGDFIFNTRTGSSTSAERLRITSDGNVGIGTTSPSAKLDVNGDATINSITVGKGANSVTGNTVLGENALDAAVTGGNNTAIGDSALTSLTSATSNVAVGHDALRTNTTGNTQVAIGDSALYSNSTGLDNVAIGAFCLYSNSTASNNVGVGRRVLFANTTGTNNVAMGYGALDANTTANNNTAIGYNSLTANTTGQNNTAVGRLALALNTTASDNASLGSQALNLNTTGASNVAVGRLALYANTTASNNTAVGKSALQSNTTGTSNVAVGAFALDANTTGNSCTAVGFRSFGANTTGTGTAVGKDALLANTTGTANTAVGAGSLDANTTASYNTAVGNNALTANTSGSQNAAVGHDALSDNTTGDHNVAMGSNALAKNTTADYNTAFGSAALYENTTGDRNVALGFQTLFTNTVGDKSVAIGMQALYTQNPASNTDMNNIAIGHAAAFNTTTGINNTAIGNNSLFANTTGAQNVAVGYGALDANTTANNNVAVGYDSLTNNTTGTRNIGLGMGSCRDTTTGDSNTALGHNCLKKNTTASNNTAVGAYCLDANTTGANNTGLGYDVLSANTTGTQNVAIGSEALKANTTADYNTAIGRSALKVNTTGEYNTAIGGLALFDSTTASYNVAIGYTALYENTTGDSNTGIGFQALQGNTTGQDNVAVGRGTLYLNTTAVNNIAVGRDALFLNTTGSSNSALGKDALKNNSTGAANTAVGVEALTANTTGGNNVALGRNALKGNTEGTGNIGIGRAAGDSITTGDNNTVIGYNADASSATVNNEITLGDSNIATLRCNVQTISSLSDARDKTNVIDLPEGLDFVTKLRPVKFEWATRDGNGKDGSFEHGFIAQDLQAAQKENNADYLNMVMDENPDRLEASYGKLVPILVKAIQELTMEVNKLKSNG